MNWKTIFRAGNSMLLFLLLTGCKDNSDMNVLAIIDGKDSVTAADFKLEVERATEKKDLSIPVYAKRLILDRIIKERIKYMAGAEKRDSSEDPSQDALLKRDILANAAFNKYFWDQFFTDQEIQRYKQYFNAEATIQNILIRFGNIAGITRNQAHQRMDSIHRILTKHNFSEVAKNVSEFKNSITGKVLTEPQRVKIGQLPYGIEKEIVRMSPGQISYPIELMNAFVIIRFNSIDTTLKKNLSYDEVKSYLKSKMGDFESEQLSIYQQRFLDSLYNSAKPVISRSNVISLSKYLARQESNKGLDSDEWLVTYSKGKITVGDFSEEIKKYDGIKDTSEILDILRSMCVKDLLMDLSIKDGFAVSDEFKSMVQKVIRESVIAKIDAQIWHAEVKVSDEQLMQYYRRNREHYRSVGELELSEIYSRDKTLIDRSRQLAETGILFEKIPEMLKKEHKRANVDFRKTVKLEFNSKNELAKKAARLDIHQISDVIPRKDGGFSIIRIIKKEAPRYFTFEFAKKRIEDDLKNSIRTERERTWYFDETKKRKVIIFENNLFNLE